MCNIPPGGGERGGGGEGLGEGGGIIGKENILITPTNSLSSLPDIERETEA